jgi:ABC-type amino acid transport substrate-binding protein
MKPRLRSAGAVCAAVALAAVVGSTQRAGADLDAITARGSVRVLADPDDDPAWFSAKGGDAPGFEREVLEGFARRHKLRFETVPVERWADAIPMLQAGKGDLLAGVNVTPARQRLVDFTTELLPARHLVVTRHPQPPILTLEELRASRVVVVPHTTWADAVAAAGVPASSTTSVKDVAAALQALRDGRATATVTDVLDYLVQRRGDKELQVGMSLGDPLSSAWAVRKSDPQLRQALDAYLVELRGSANWSRLLVKYYGADAPAVLGRAAAK